MAVVAAAGIVGILILGPFLFRLLALAETNLLDLELSRCAASELDDSKGLVFGPDWNYNGRPNSLSLERAQSVTPLHVFFDISLLEGEHSKT